MKKLLTFILALTMVFTFAACGEADEPVGDAHPGVPLPDVTESEETTPEPEPETIVELDAEPEPEIIDDDLEPEPEPTPDPEPEPIPVYVTPFTDADKTMYITGTTANVRAEYNTDSDIRGTLSHRDSVRVTGISTDAGVEFYRVEFNGGTAYIHSSLLSDTQPLANVVGSNTGGGNSQFPPQRNEFNTQEEYIQALEKFYGVERIIGEGGFIRVGHRVVIPEGAVSVIDDTPDDIRLS